MPNETYLRPNDAEAAAQILDDEVIIIRLADGIYYSMQGVGVLVWRLIDAKRTVDEVIQVIAEHYGVDLDRVGRDIKNLVEGLQKERLIVLSEEPIDGAIRSNVVLDDLDGSHYATPALNVYEDMNDLLALDPPSPGQQAFASPDNRE